MAFKRDIAGYVLNRRGHKIIGTAQKYNAMEFARSATLVAMELFEAKSEYTQVMHNNYLSEQTGNRSEFALTTRGSVLDTLRRVKSAECSWVTAWVANCEFRQAEQKYGMPEIWRLVTKYEGHKSKLRPLIQTAVANPGTSFHEGWHDGTQRSAWLA